MNLASVFYWLRQPSKQIIEPALAPSSQNAATMILQDFTSSLVQTLIPVSTERLSLPSIFKLDIPRLNQLHIELINIVHTEIAISVLLSILPRFPQHTNTITPLSTLRARLAALLSWCPGSAHIAAEIARVALDVPLHAAYIPPSFSPLADEIERILIQGFNGALFTTEATKVRDALINKLHASVASHIHSSPAVLCEMLVVKRDSRPQVGVLDSGSQLEDKIRRITHIVVLQWRVWAPILFDARVG